MSLFDKGYADLPKHERALREHMAKMGDWAPQWFRLEALVNAALKEAREPTPSSMTGGVQSEKGRQR